MEEKAQETTFTIGGVNVTLRHAHEELTINASGNIQHKQQILALIRDTLDPLVRQHIHQHSKTAPLEIITLDEYTSRFATEKHDATFSFVENQLKELAGKIPDTAALHAVTSIGRVTIR